MAKRLRRLNKLEGDVPYIYKPRTIYTMCILINALVDAVNFLNEQMQELQKEGAEDGK